MVMNLIPFFTNLVLVYNLFYINGIKVVPTALEIFMIFFLTLTIWISDDGGGISSGVKLSTHSFTESEVLFLIQLLKSKFNLDCTMLTILQQTINLKIYIKANSIPLFR